MTTPESIKPNAARDLLLIHRIITRAIEVTQQKGQQFQAEGFPDPIVRQGYRDYVQCLVTVLGAHHLTEDEVVFPQLGTRIPSAPYKLLSADHQKMTGLLDDIQTSINNFNEDGNKQEIDLILNRLKQLKEMWYPHIGIEEGHITEKNIDETMSAEEKQTFSQQTSKYSQEHISPDFLVVPFLLFNLNATERSVFSAAMPPIVTQQLIPHVWKEKWQPMQPFLLMD